MGKYVCMGAQLQCTFGMAPSCLIVADPQRPLLENKPQANILDNKPGANIPPFGMCQSMGNPQVQAATAAAQGVLTPMPCTPMLTAPWAPPGKILICNQPALLDNGMLMCSFGGQISIKNPGQQSVESR